MIARLLAWLRHRPAVPAGPVPPEALRRAVATCGYNCLECQSPTIVLHWAPALGWIPTVRHWQLSDGDWCPVLGSDVLLAMESMDLLDALAAVTVVSQYWEPVWHAREFAAAA